MGHEPETFPIRRWLLLLVPGSFFLIMLLTLVFAPDTGSRMSALPITLVFGYFSVRARRVCVLLTDSHLVVRGLWRTRRVPWDEVIGSKLTRMRTGSPFAARWPYVALTITTIDGRERQTGEIAAPATEAVYLERLVTAINRRAAG